MGCGGLPRSSTGASHICKKEGEVWEVWEVWEVLEVWEVWEFSREFLPNCKSDVARCTQT
ncbi:MAG: hypothetical protein F6K26_36170 [Moorea sp. SIO2I5]|nr:hypothetical protein [Moorena sp. SIO2I5]